MVTEKAVKLGATEGMTCPLCGKTNYTGALHGFFECFECEGGFLTPSSLAQRVAVLDRQGTWALENKGETFAKWARHEVEHKGRVGQQLLKAWNAWKGRGEVLGGPQARVLEVGFGNGAMLAEFKLRGWVSVGIDRSKEAVDTGRRNGLDCWEMRIDGPEPLPWGDFDLVYAWDSLEHVQDPRQAFANIRRALSPRGIFVMHSPDFKKYHLVKEHPYWEQSHLVHMTARTAGVLANQAGIPSLKQEWGAVWGDRGLANRDNFVFWGGWP